jgi:hypothetical protein
MAVVQRLYFPHPPDGDTLGRPISSDNPPTATTSMMSEGNEYVHRYDVHEGLSFIITATRP